MLTIILIALLVKAVFCFQDNIPPEPNKTFIYHRYAYDKRIVVYVNDTTEHVLDFYENKTEDMHFPTRVHMSTNDTVNNGHPVFITATQQKAVSSWSLPLVVRTPQWALVFSDMGRTLCPHDAGPDIKSENRPTVQITTSSPKNVSVDIKLKRVTDFYVEVNQPVHMDVKPSTPKYYYFSFDQNPWNVTNGHLESIRSAFNYTIPKSVILIIESDDDVCATVSIQNNSCPVFDNEKEILYQGNHLTMTTKGGITLTQTEFPAGFYVVFIVKQSDDECTGGSETANLAQRPKIWKNERLKKFRFTIVATISYQEYVVGALVTLAVVALVVVVVLLALLPCRSRCSEEVVILDEEPVPSTSGINVNEDDELVASEDAPIIPAQDERVATARHAYALTVEQLCRAPPDTLARRAHRYFWGALTVAIVYALPVVQLLFTYQQMVFQTGNQDLCYYNFLCAHPLGFLSDFNHVFSNVGYVLLGAVFLLQVRVRQLASIKYGREGMGIPQHYGLLYSMGLGLTMEGVLSACYHLCPNKMNFQFDSSFMYVIAVLCMIKLYQNRHSDIIPSAHSTFMLLAFIMTLGLLGILFPSVAFSVLFTILHLFTCCILTLKIYYAGTFKMDRSVARRAWGGVRQHRWRALLPAHRARAILLALANVANWTFAIYCILKHNKDFARQLLAILMGNAFLHTMFYFVMKLVHREKILVHTWVYGALAVSAWVAATIQFTDSKTHWSESPAQSRRHNAVCSSLRFYDSHDLWHVGSAAAMFLSFNMLLTVDDALAAAPRDLLPTF